MEMRQRKGPFLEGPHFKGSSESALPLAEGGKELVWLEMLGEVISSS